MVKKQSKLIPPSSILFKGEKFGNALNQGVLSTGKAYEKSNFLFILFLLVRHKSIQEIVDITP